MPVSVNSINYSDGDVEKIICSILQDEKEALSSLSNIAPTRYDDWAIRYHLSANRGNLLRPFHFSGLDVLELGAGMGGISRLIAESAAHLTIVEGSSQRLTAAKARLRDLQNWDSYCCNFQFFCPSQKYDVICLIGVLEYSEIYIDHENPFVWLLSKVNEFLKDDGVAIIALENKNGLKYFSGATEDHTGRHFDGICGYSKEQSVRTFSYNEMLNFFDQAGFGHICSFFPHPDYKMPRVIFTELMLQTHAKFTSQVMATYPSEDYCHRHRYLFPEALAWESLADSGLLKEMSNSFLFLATNRAESETLAKLQKSDEDAPLAWCYATDRKTPKQTVFFDCEGQLITVKMNLQGGKETFLGLSASSPVLVGEYYLTHLFRKMHFEGKDALNKELYDFFEIVFSSFKYQDERFLLSNAIDALPQNAILTQNGLRFFDLEWDLKRPMEKSWYIYRNIFILGGCYKLFSQCDKNYSLKSYYDMFCSSLKIKPDFEEDCNREEQFQLHATGVFQKIKIKHPSCFKKIRKYIKSKIKEGLDKLL